LASLKCQHNLVKHAHEQEWREVIILAAGLAKLNERSQIINQLIERGDNEYNNRHQLHMLAVACLETSVELEANIKRKLPVA
jgi:hypothetical protein